MFRNSLLNVPMETTIQLLAKAFCNSCNFAKENELYSVKINFPFKNNFEKTVYTII